MGEGPHNSELALGLASVKSGSEHEYCEYGIENQALVYCLVCCNFTYFILIFKTRVLKFALLNSTLTPSFRNKFWD